MPPLAVPDDEFLNALAHVARLRIRQAQQGDLNSLAQIATALNYEAPTNLALNGHTTFVALDTSNNDSVSGFLWFLRSTWDGAGFFVRLVMTHAQKVHRGVGPLLMAYACKAMHNSEPEMPISLVVKSDNHGAKRWYDKLEIRRVLPWPGDLDEDESEVAQNEQGQYQYRRNASPEAVMGRAVANLKLTVQGTLIGDPDYSPKRQLRFRRPNAQDHYLTFYAQPDLLAFTDVDQNKTVTFTSFSELKWDGPGFTRSLPCYVWST